MRTPRRVFLRRTGMAVAGAAIMSPRPVLAQASESEQWRAFEITTTVEIQRPDGPTRAWLPTPLVDTPYQRTLGDTYRANGGFVEMVERPDESVDMLVAEWPAGVAPTLTVTSRVRAREYAADLTVPRVPPPLDMTAFARYMRPARLVPIDGVVKETAESIVRGAGTDFERAQAIYEWMARKTSRDPNARGCGVGDVRSMLASGNLTGECADLSALFVALARASGIPARVVFGLRLSRRDATRGQHCRAEAYLTGYGWVPVELAETRAFGSWSTIWIAFNYAQDVTLPGSRRGSINYFAYPQAETAAGRIDSFDAEAFRYEISVREG